MRRSIAFVYKVDYIGNIPEINSKSYIGSKRYSGNWEQYLGSPASKTCKISRLWKQRILTHPYEFKREILLDIFHVSDILTYETLVMNQYNVTLGADGIWINRCFPKPGGFLDSSMSPEQRKEVHSRSVATYKHKYHTSEKFRQTIKNKRELAHLEKYGVKHFSQLESSKVATRIRLQTPEVRNKRGKSIKISLNKLTKEEWNVIAAKKFIGLKKWFQNPENVIKNKILRKNTALENYVTMYNNTTNECESMFIKDWLSSLDIRTGEIFFRIRGVRHTNIISPLTGHVYRYINTIKRHRVDIT